MSTKGCVACVARRSFCTFSLFHINVDDVTVEIEVNVRREIAAMRRPGFRVGMQTMVDMNGKQGFVVLPPGSRQHVREHRGIKPATQRNNVTIGSCRKFFELSEPLQEGLGVEVHASWAFMITPL